MSDCKKHKHACKECIEEEIKSLKEKRDELDKKISKLEEKISVKKVTEIHIHDSGSYPNWNNIRNKEPVPLYPIIPGNITCENKKWI